MRHPGLVVSALGIGQIVAWGSSFYLPTILTRPIADDTGWSFAWVAGGLSVGLLVAGMVAPLVGTQIGRRGGREVLAASSALLASGLVVLGTAPNLAVYFAAWVLIGLGMAAGLYDAAFSALGRLYGQAARPRIAAVTLFGGLASTLCWPLSSMFLSEFGWRGTCLAYAAIHVAVLLPTHLLALPNQRPLPAQVHVDPHADGMGRHEIAAAPFLLLGTTIALASMVSTMISVHLMVFLDYRGVALAAAVALGTLIGPAQLVARLVELAAGRFVHPVWTHVASAALVAAGLALLCTGLSPIWFALLLYGGGIGLESIARATVPLVLFGANDYARIMGKLATPSLVVQAVAPTVGALLVTGLGSGAALRAVAGIATVNLSLTIAFLLVTNSQRSRDADRP